MREIITIGSLLLTNCASIPESQGQKYTISEIYNSCSYFTNIDGCEAIQGQKITIQGVFYFPDWDNFHPNIYPLGTKMSLIDSHFDGTISSESLDDYPEDFSLWVYPSTKKYRKNLQKFHGKEVSVTGIAETNCAVVNTQTGGGGIDEEGNIWWIGGYCHTQTDVYMKDFEVQLLN